MRFRGPLPEITVTTFVPSAFITQMSDLKPLLRVNAILDPSGE